MKQLIDYNGKLQLVATQKQVADQKRELAKFLKRAYDNKLAMNRTTDGNSFSRYKKDMNYWLEKAEEVKQSSVYVNEVIVESQNEIIAEFVADQADPVCKVCEGAQQNYVYQEDENGDKEAVDVVDCICTDDRWDPNNQDKCVDCGEKMEGGGCEGCYQERKMTCDLEDE